MNTYTRIWIKEHVYTGIKSCKKHISYLISLSVIHLSIIILCSRLFSVNIFPYLRLQDVFSPKNRLKKHFFELFCKWAKNLAYNQLSWAQCGTLYWMLFTLSEHTKIWFQLEYTARPILLHWLSGAYTASCRWSFFLRTDPDIYVKSCYSLLMFL